MNNYHKETFKIFSEQFKSKMLNWAKRFNIFCMPDNCTQGNDNFDYMLAADVAASIELSYGNAYEGLRNFHQQHPGWLFGHFSYDIKNEDLHLQSSHADNIGFPYAYFFVPKYLLIIKGNTVAIMSGKERPKEIFDAINEQDAGVTESVKVEAVLNTLTKDEYIAALQKVLLHIKAGDCYELNYCQEFHANAYVDPTALYQKLITISPNPFSALYRINDAWCCCASPERFLRKQNNTLISQPIKGTAPRGNTDEQDAFNKAQLSCSIKDKTENVMIVDLVRNDLSKVCLPNSVTVSNLFEVISYPGVHQMISTVTGEMKPLHWTKAIEATFPMGSMTGAPKRKVMEITEQLEKSRRGLYAGSIGYVTPEGDFDFNVVIRSIFYNQKTKYLSFMAGGGITSHSIPEKEYEECLIKTAAIRKVLNA